MKNSIKGDAVYQVRLPRYLLLTFSFVEIFTVTISLINNLYWDISCNVAKTQKALSAGTKVHNIIKQNNTFVVALSHTQPKKKGNKKSKGVGQNSKKGR